MSEKFTEWEAHVKSELTYTYPTASDSDWKMIAKILDNEMEKIGIIKNPKIEEDRKCLRTQ